MAYDLAIPTCIKVHKVFHVSLLRKYINDSNHVIYWNVIKVEPKRQFQVEPMYILDNKIIVLWNKTIGHVMVQWKKLGFDEATRELKDAMREVYPFLFKF